MFQCKFLLHFRFSVNHSVKIQFKIIFYGAVLTWSEHFFQILHACSPFNFKNTTLMHIHFFSYIDLYYTLFNFLYLLPNHP